MTKRRTRTDWAQRVQPGPTPYPELNAVLRELVSGARAVLGDRFTAAYLLGSFALGDFDVHSDVDFVIAIEDEVPDDVLEPLQDMHGRLHDLDYSWARHLDGSYIPRPILRRQDPTRAPLLYLDRGRRRLVRSDHCNRHVVRWMLRERGITLAGLDPASLIDPVPTDELRGEVETDMREWAREIREDLGPVNNRWYQPYAVLSYCRMLYTLETGTIVSKPAAAAWAQGALDPGWSDLIQRAVAERPDPVGRTRQPADPHELGLTLAFIDYVLELASGGR